MNSALWMAAQSAVRMREKSFHRLRGGHSLNCAAAFVSGSAPRLMRFIQCLPLVREEALEERQSALDQSMRALPFSRKRAPENEWSDYEHRRNHTVNASCSWPAVSSDDLGQDGALSPLIEESHSAGELLPGNSRAARKVHLLLQQSTTLRASAISLSPICASHAERTFSRRGKISQIRRSNYYGARIGKRSTEL
jgi:hypothetical protein